MTSALRTGYVLCIIGLITVLVALFLVSLFADQMCDLQPTAGQLAPDILDNIPGDECAELITAGFFTIFAVPGTLLLLIGSFIVVMAVTNRIAYKKFGYRIKNDWGSSIVDDRADYMDK